jgi:protoheme IX farnesyltransferase
LPVELGQAGPAAVPSRLHQYLELIKFRLNALVLVTTAVGFLAASMGSMNWPLLLWTLLGTWLLASGAAALNQVIEVPRDARMKRTRHRPLPSGHMGRLHATLVALAMVFAGYLILGGLVNLLTAGLGLANVIIYVVIYTPLKVRTSLNTLVGAIVGALPPMMGWAAATGELGTGAWLLGAMLFVWQIPHFLALAWMYRDDYISGGYQMLSRYDVTGHLTGLLSVLYSLALLPLGVVFALKGVTGWPFAFASLPLALMLLVLAVDMAGKRTRQSARRLFFGSIIYLPVVLVLLVADARPRPAAPPDLSTPLVSPIIQPVAGVILMP